MKRKLDYVHTAISERAKGLIPDKLYLSMKFRQKMGYWMDWSHPRTFCEKLQWLKVYDRHEEYTQMVDKLAAKDYVASIIGEKYIIPVIHVYRSAEEIDFDPLPNQFVLKCTHDSGSVFICRDKSKFDADRARRMLQYNLMHNFAVHSREYPYKHVPRCILAEPYFEDESGNELRDYKIFCFNGRAEYCQIIANRSTDKTIDFYDRARRHQPFVGLIPKAHNAPARSNTLMVCSTSAEYNQMLAIADKISSKVGAPFVRIDLYNIHHHIYFGEITFFPASGFGQIIPLEWDRKLGDMIMLPPSK